MATNVKVLDLKIMRLKAGICHYDLAARLGIPPSRLLETESGRQEPSRELLERLLPILNRRKSGEGHDEG